MNGISVMACVQTNQTGFSGAYGRESRIQQKYITISHQNGQKVASGRKADRVCASTGRSSAVLQDQSAERRAVRAGRTAGTDTVARADGTERNAQKGCSAGQSSHRAVRRSSSSGRASAGRRGSAIAVRTLVLAVIFAGMLAGFQMMTRASSREKEQTYKYYTTVTIGYGEDLSDIVFQYCDRSEYESADAYVREICDINSLPYHKGSVPDLNAGAKIVIPYYSTVLK